MIQVSRLKKLHGVARMRKCAVLLENVELQLARSRSSEADSLFQYLREVAGFFAQEAESDSGLIAAAETCLAGLSIPEFAPRFRALNDFRHYLMRISGQAPADWDLHDYSPPQGRAEGREGAARARGCLPGLRVFLEDIRSPFNVGTILRTAEALGFEEALLSPRCADPRHPRALRSSMGAVDIMPWRRCSPEELVLLGPVFALELGGTDLNEFAFPRGGVLILGSEELGVSTASLALAAGGRVSIPMRGAKASINVAVAFGIAAQAWISSLLH